MKATAFLVGTLAAVSVASGLIFLKTAKHIMEGKKHGKPSTFREVFEDNESDDLGELYEDSYSL